MKRKIFFSKIFSLKNRRKTKRPLCVVFDVKIMLQLLSDLFEN